MNLDDEQNDQEETAPEGTSLVPARRRRLPDAAKPFMFKKGISGNPGGRPKGAKSLTTLLREAAEMDAGLGDGRTIGQILVEKLINLAIDEMPDRQALVAIFDRVDGKPTQTVNIQGSTEKSYSIHNDPKDI